MPKTKTKERFGPCDVVPPCKDACPGWVPASLSETDPVWQDCACGHSRHVHRLGLPVVPEPAPPRICPCCGQPLPKEKQ